MSSKRRIRRRSCEGKIHHKDQTGAIGHCKSLGEGVCPYKCKFCHGWHVGRFTKEAKAAWRARHDWG